jgi:hypothetical protein
MAGGNPRRLGGMRRNDRWIAPSRAQTLPANASEAALRQIAGENMARGLCKFRQQDVARALRAAFAAGATRAQVQVGDILITAEKAPDGEAIVHGGDNEWDAPLAGEGTR